MLKLNQLCYSFSPEKLILNNLTLDFEKEKVYALMGNNGAGKTTLFNLITGYIKPQSGFINFNDIEISNKKPFMINRIGICRTFQDIRLIGGLTVLENVKLAMRHNLTDKLLNAIFTGKNSSIESKLIDKKANEILNQFYLFNESSSFASNISFGQQKLLSIACCVANGASLLLLDEPVAGIQPEYRNRIIMLIKQLKNEGKTIIIIEHNSEFIDQVADKVFFLNEGAINTFDKIEDLRNNDQIMESFY